MGLGIAVMILALCFMFMSGVLFEAEVKLWPVWALASAGATALSLCFAGGIF
jgi:hypothetical protein